jgi:hypothetical protein
VGRGAIARGMLRLQLTECALSSATLPVYNY